MEPTTLEDLLGRLPEDLYRQVFTHSSWVSDGDKDSYQRLAFLGDSVLSLAITSYLYPILDPSRYGAGALSKLRAQIVSGRACRGVAERLEVPRRLIENQPNRSGTAAEKLVKTERVLASIMEAIIGACYLTFGYETTANAVVSAFEPEIAAGFTGSEDYKTDLQEWLARSGKTVRYLVISEDGPPHDRCFKVHAEVAGATVGSGEGTSKKAAEQLAAKAALLALQDDKPDNGT